MSARTQVSPDELAEHIRSGAIDTVLTVFPDLQGRLVGKRTSGRFYLEHVAGPEGYEACDYLIATDMDNNPVPGYRFANYQQGYGDMRAVVDPETIRITPWIEKTALVMCDVVDVDDGTPIEVAPRQVLRRQEEAAAALGYTPMLAAEIEFYLFRDSFDEAYAKGYKGLVPHSPFLEDYHILQTTKDEYIIGQIRRGLEAAGVPCEFSKGEAGRGQHEINLDYTTAVEMADRNTIYKTAAKEIAASSGRSISFMAKYDFDDTGSSCHIHSSLWDAGGDETVMADHHGEHGMSQVFRWYLGGLLATAREFSILFAPYVNSYKRFQLGSWAPTTVGWGVDNRTLGFRKVGHGAGTRVESRIPGSDANSYLAFAATIAGGLYGIRNQIEPPPAFEGSGYDDHDLPRIPWNIVDAIELWQSSTVAKEAFGEEVHFHLGHAAEEEWAAFNRCVTDWELMRYFERA
jgi:glutamine synthetase